MYIVHMVTIVRPANLRIINFSNEFQELFFIWIYIGCNENANRFHISRKKKEEEEKTKSK